MSLGHIFVPGLYEIMSLGHIFVPGPYEICPWDIYLSLGYMRYVPGTYIYVPGTYICPWAIRDMSLGYKYLSLGHMRYVPGIILE
jgi:hypothetical protein